MPNKKKKNVTSAEIAERAKPNWKAVKAYGPRQSTADANSPEIEELKRKYLGNTFASDYGSVKKPKKGDLKVVIMEEKNPHDTRVGRKTVLIQKGKIVGQQG